ncbi:PSD1 and planctomycete cytochrome C domain-containing protein [Stieleria neptunia]|uniref:PSD1 and planctomycete cytochrome C domain-containing protein n=1 Tax=Stieleria neptunia TaxID=2527979 RepID=UPI0018D2380E|nr:PSD1 and planctomycete cytochrome C domain-containing protein [Stieleria neptunia]
MYSHRQDFASCLTRTSRLSCYAVGLGILFLATCLPAVGAPVPQDKTATSSEQEEFFETKVRPLLVQHCVECHGPEDQSGELRLDRQDHFKRGGGSGPVVVPGDVKASRLIRAIGYRDNGLQMPPDSKLPEEAIRVLSDWVRSGASWPEEAIETDQTVSMSPEEHIEAQRRSHWSYQPIATTPPPSIADLVARVGQDQVDAFGGDGMTAIDRFVLARLSDGGLAPNPRADRRTLIHRAYHALLGLPPTYEQVQAFVADEQPDAFARLVDRLLENPHYGERWARHWLDIARYGDTKGYLAGNRETRYPYAFTYRDYVIDAFNRDKPFDQFVIEQLAADQLDLTGEARSALAAMGFLTVGRRFMNRKHDIIDDQIDVVTRGFLGMSVACARCHDHKFDAIPTADYYSLYGVFASSEEPSELPLLGDPQSTPEYEAFLKAKAEKQQEVDKWVEERRQGIENELRSRVADYLVYIAKSLPQYSKGKVQPQGKRGALRLPASRRWQQYLVNANASPHPVWELLRQLAALPLDEFAAKSATLLDQAATATETTEGQEPANPIPQRLLDSLREAQPTSLPEAAQVFGDVLEAVYAQWIEARKADESLERLPDAGDETLRQVLWSADAPTTLDSGQAIAHLDQAERGKYNQLLGGVNGVSVTHPGAPPRGMVMFDKPKPVEPVIFRRGVPGNRGDRVPRRFLQVLSHVDGGKPFEQGSGRLELAQAIADPENPLTARVIVNRVWQHQFGEGLVRTPSDFGIRGELPTHPDLLDDLAAGLIADGWSIKRLQRRIMLSATWQQSSDTRPAAIETDPENRLLWHMPRRRMDFEPLRDRLLSVAGRLDESVGGRSVMIHQDATRRALYAYIDREDLPGLLASFDLPSPDASQAKRAKTTVPQQALYLMNSGFVIEQAKALAERSEAERSKAEPEGPTGDDTEQVATDRTAERIKRLYRLALARDPAPAELQVTLEFVTPGSEATLDPWVQLAQVLLLSNEFAFVD